jgi:hypothetical protein
VSSKNPINPPAQPEAVQEPVAWPEHEFIQWGAKKYGPLVQAAINLLAEIDSNHDSKSYPQKYGVPYGAVNTLRDALTATPPAQPDVQPVCQKCSGTGQVEEGGVYPSGDLAYVPCECTTKPAAKRL